MNGLGTRHRRSTTCRRTRGNDDCFEWFGGTVRAKFLVATAAATTSSTGRSASRGSLQFGVAHQLASGVDGSGRNGLRVRQQRVRLRQPAALEPAHLQRHGDRRQEPGPRHLGRRREPAPRHGRHHLEHHFSGWPSACLDIDNDETIARGCTGPATLRTGADTLLVSNSVCNNNGPTGTTLAIGSTTAPACTPAQLVGLWAPSTANPNIPWASAVTFPTNPINTADYVPTAPLAGPDCEALDPGAFDSAPFIGALQNGGINWMNDSAACAASQVGDCWLNADQS